MPMKNPPHPGRIIRQDCVEPSGLTITQAAKVLGRQPAGAQQSGQRKGRDLSGDGCQDLQGFRGEPGNVAASAGQL